MLSFWITSCNSVSIVIDWLRCPSVLLSSERHSSSFCLTATTSRNFTSDSVKLFSRVLNSLSSKAYRFLSWFHSFSVCCNLNWSACLPFWNSACLLLRSVCTRLSSNWTCCNWRVCFCILVCVSLKTRAFLLASWSAELNFCFRKSWADVTELSWDLVVASSVSSSRILVWRVWTSVFACCNWVLKVASSDPLLFDRLVCAELAESTWTWSSFIAFS